MNYIKNNLVKISAVIIFLNVSFISIKTKAAIGDTIVVQTFTYGSPQDSTFIFPSDTISFSKILMLYTLKCPSGGCGQWDYLTYTYLYSNNTRYELGRYITPYGIGLSLGNGFTWTYDVTDYRTLLHDSVHLAAGNNEELLNVSFLMIKGMPARNVKSIQNIWSGEAIYTTPTSWEALLKPTYVVPDSTAKSWRLKLRTTGHGQSGPNVCAEFCPQDHSILIDSVVRYKKTVFRTDCGLNPVAAQGGTWVYSRSNWCPGADVFTYDIELTPWLTAGKQALLSYFITPYTWDSTNYIPYYQTEAQLITYGDFNFKNDIAIADIIAPTSNDIYRRMNPVCGDAIIKIQNNGGDTLTSADISYGIVGGNMLNYHWTGKLGFSDTQNIVLPGNLNWASSGKFQATVSNPNGQQDEYLYNNTMTSDFVLPPAFPNKFIIYLKTNNNPQENAWTLTDSWGQLIKSGTNLSANTIYRDTVNLQAGCYVFHLTDDGAGGAGDGLTWWADTAQGSGTFEFRKSTGGILKTYNSDFGAEIYQQFSVGAYSNIGEDVHPKDAELDVFPNPSKDIFNIELNLPQMENITLIVYDLFGKIVYTKAAGKAFDLSYSLDLHNLSSGVYILSVMTENRVVVRRLVKE
jgi:hypothetical protein